MKKYLCFFRIQFLNGLQYRAAAFAGIVTQFAWGFMELAMFSAFYRADSAVFPMTFPQLASYIWLQQAFLALFMTWFLDKEIFADISSGNIAYALSRPASLYPMWFFKNLALRLSKAVLRCFPVLIVAALLPPPYNVSPPASFSGFFMFLFSMVLGFLVVVSFCMLIYISTFYLMNPLGVRIVALSMTEFLSGAIIPLPFLPDGVRRVVSLLPFASMQNLPFRIYSGNLAGREMWLGILLQGFWFLALSAFGRWWMKQALRRVVIQGG